MVKLSDVKRKRKSSARLRALYLAGPASDLKLRDACLDAQLWLRENDPDDAQYSGNQLPFVSRGFWFRFRRFHRFFALWTYLSEYAIAVEYRHLADVYAMALEHLLLLKRAGVPDLKEVREEAAEAREQLAAAIFYVPEGKTGRYTSAERMLDHLDSMSHFRVLEKQLGLEPVQ